MITWLFAPFQSTARSHVQSFIQFLFVYCYSHWKNLILITRPLLVLWFTCPSLQLVFWFTWSSLQLVFWFTCSSLQLVLIHLPQAPARLLVLQISQDPARAALSSSLRMAIHVQVWGSLLPPVINHKTMGYQHTLPIRNGSLFSWRKCTWPSANIIFKRHLSGKYFFAIFFNHVLTQKGGSLCAPIDYYSI